MSPRAQARVTVIRPAAGWAPLHLRELVESHELLYFLVLRSLKVRYKQTLLGATWAVLQPLLTMAIFSLVFGRLAKLGSEGVPYPIFALDGARAVDLFRERADPGQQQPGRAGANV